MADLWKRLEALLPEVSRPARYIDSEYNVRPVDIKAAEVSFALVYPDAYEVGAPNLGLAILYEILTSVEGVACDRAFAPWPDMEERLAQAGLPLFGLASRHPLAGFDAVAITLQYEMTYTNILTVLSLGGIPLRQKDRSAGDPLILGGGPCAVNPEPVAPFFDAILVGDGEEAVVEIAAVIREGKASAWSREEILARLAGIEGCYVPSLYEVYYNEDATIARIEPARREAPALVQRRVAADLTALPIPGEPVVPFAEVVHDRLAIEIMRGCTRGCRFCQAGMIYRPVRERPPEQVIEAARRIVASTGYEDLSLVSLSSSDYSSIASVAGTLCRDFVDRGVALSLPSQRVDAFSVALARSISQLKKTGLTFAPEAGTQRLRDVINKQVTEEDFERTIREAFSSGWKRLKLYYMIGLPTETEEDIEGIGKMVDQGARVARQALGGGGQVFNVSVSSLVPKAHSPFQWARQDSLDEILSKQEILKRSVSRKVAKLSWHDAEVSVVEGVLARGDRRLANVIEQAWRLGSRFDAWTDRFDFGLWMRALAECRLDVAFYARGRGDDELFPWEHISGGASRRFLLDQWRKALEGRTTGDCRFESCTACGVCGSGVDNVLHEAEERRATELAREPAERGKTQAKPARHRLRLCYAKRGPLRFLSHLEVAHGMERAVRRAGLPFSVSGGFSPKMRISYAPPLPVGAAGIREYLDILLTDEPDTAVVARRLSEVLPSGLDVIEAAYVPLQSKSLSSVINVADYEVRVDVGPDRQLDAAAGQVERILEEGSIEVERKGRRVGVQLSEVVRRVQMPQNVAGVFVHHVSLYLNRGVHLRPEVLLVEALHRLGVGHAPPAVTRTGLYIETPEGVKSVMEEV
ncbi:MAG: TIGR03960 family B12-binding radical SAM protein [Actinobacteria bacterium]|nr:MAG: TIGR03960 family B12-binding radical SAM protein [Actinomycetota bacterium]